MNKRVLTQSDFGTPWYFDIPWVGNQGVSQGLVSRIGPDGKVHVFVQDSGSQSGDLHEFVVPDTPGTIAAPYAHYLGALNPPGGWWALLPGHGGATQLLSRALYRDHVTGRIYRFYHNSYDTSPNPKDYSFTGCTLNDSTHTATNIGCWGVDSAQSFEFAGGVVDLPDWFQSEYLQAGRRWAILNVGRNAGSGGDQGPRLTVVIPPTDTNAAPGGVPPPNLLTPLATLLHYGGGPQGTWVLRPARTFVTSYVDRFYNNNPEDGHGYWTADGATDEPQLAVAIDTPDAQGLLVIHAQSSGRITTTVAASPAPTDHSMRLGTATAGDVDPMVGDYLHVQTNTDGIWSSQCPGTMGVRVTGVNGRDVTFQVDGGGTGEGSTGVPLVGGTVYGAILYCYAAPRAMRNEYPWSVYDLNDLGAVATNQMASDAPDPVHQWAGVYNGQRYFQANSGVYPSGLTVATLADGTQAVLFAINYAGPYPAAPTRVYVVPITGSVGSVDPPPVDPPPVDPPPVDPPPVDPPPDPDVPPVIPPTDAPTVTSAPKTCTVTLKASPPTGTNWRAQFLKDGKSFGTTDASPPYTRTATLPVGRYTFRVKWTKVGHAPVYSEPVTVYCP